MSFKQFDAIRDELKRSVDYQREKARIDFAAELWTLMEQNGVSRAKLAEKLGKTAPWVTKVLSGDNNFTINTMVELAHAAGGDLCLHIAHADTVTRWLTVHRTNAVASSVSGWGEPAALGVKIAMEKGNAQESLAA